MSTNHINPHWVIAFCEQLTRCDVQSVKSTAVLSEAGTRPILLETMLAALNNLNIAYQHKAMPFRAEQPGPVGLNVFVLKGVVGDVTTGTIFRGVTPFWIADLFRLALLLAIPTIVLFLPNQM